MQERPSIPPRSVRDIANLIRYAGGKTWLRLIGEPFARGHYYSPLPDIHSVLANDTLFDPAAHTDPSIDMNPAVQREILTDVMRTAPDFDWPNRPGPSRRFYTEQDFFNYADAVVLLAMLRRFRPRRIVEIGAGHTTALMLDIPDRFSELTYTLTSIDPYPQRLKKILGPHDRSRLTLLETNLQQVPIDQFTALKANDVLFVDSSHVSKAGSDVNDLFFRILPRLHRGVLVHFHDVFWPLEYPKAWIKNGWAWNEIYLLHAFLQYNKAFEVLWCSRYAAHAFPHDVQLIAAFRESPGGAFWMRRT